MSGSKFTAAEVISDFRGDTAIFKAVADSTAIKKGVATIASDLYRGTSPATQDKEGNYLASPQQKPYFFNGAFLYPQLEAYYLVLYPNAEQSFNAFFRKGVSKGDDKQVVDFLCSFFMRNGIPEKLVGLLIERLHQDGFYNRTSIPVTKVLVAHSVYPDEYADIEKKYYIFYNAEVGLEILQEYNVDKATGVQFSKEHFTPDGIPAIERPIMMLDKETGQEVPEKKQIALKTLTYHKVKTAADGTVASISTEYFVSAKNPEIAKAVAQDVLYTKDNEGKTPLHHAAQKGNADEVLRLVDSGVDPCIKDNEGKMAVDYAQQVLAVHQYLHALTCVQSLMSHQDAKQEKTGSDSQTEDYLARMKEKLVKTSEKEIKSIEQRTSEFVTEAKDVRKEVEKSGSSAVFNLFAQFFRKVAKVLNIGADKNSTQDVIVPKGGESHREAFYRTLEPVLGKGLPRSHSAPSMLGASGEQTVAQPKRQRVQSSPAAFWSPTNEEKDQREARKMEMAQNPRSASQSGLDIMYFGA